MEIVKIDGCTRVLGAPSDWDHTKAECVGLPIFDHPEGWMISEWRPTVEELQALQNGGTIRLWVSGSAHPVVSIEAVAASGEQMRSSTAELEEQNRWLRQTLTSLAETLRKQTDVCQLALDATK